jgi:hypothetical protein
MSTTDSQRPVVRVVQGQYVLEGAGVRVRRTIGLPSIDHIDPFLLLDEFKSDDPRDYLKGFPTHPHRGFETVSYMLEGRFRHEDSLGNSGVLEAGDAQWMTAGRGIVHSEMPAQRSGKLWGYQLWVNLPRSEKMCRPRYQDIRAQEIPEVETDDGARVRVVCGSVDGARGPVNGVAAAPVYLDVSVPPTTSFDHGLPEGHSAFAYVMAGTVRFGPLGQDAREGSLVVLGPGDRVHVRAEDEGGRFLLVAGRPFGEPVVRHGPFVMNTWQEIEEAFEDYRKGRLQVS